jgi:hypothetical protein
MDLPYNSELSKSTGSLHNRDEISATLLYVFTLIGLPESKIPTGFAKEVLFDFINNYHSRLEPQAIKEAFSLAVAGALDVKTDLYNQVFNAELFGRVIAAYKKHKQEKAAEVKPFVAIEEKHNENLTPEQSYKLFINQLETLKSIPFIWDWDKLFKHLEVIGEIKDTNEDKEMFVECFKAKLKSECEKKKYNKLIEDKNYFKKLCRKERIKNYLKTKYNFIK